MIDEVVRIDPRFCGPPDSGNGGMTAGELARVLRGPSEITLKAPPPLGRDMHLHGDSTRVTLTCEGHDIASGVVKPLAMPSDLPEVSADFDSALACQPDYAGFKQHNFPRCFVCGPERGSDDGLRVFAAPSGPGVVAAWRPSPWLADTDGRVDARFVHAALDCPTYFALGDTRIVALLGRMHCAIHERPAPGERLTITASAFGQDGRKHQSAARLHAADGRVLAEALNTWIRIDGNVPKPPVPSLA